MSVQTPATIQVHPVTPLIGAEISGLDLSRPLDAQTVREIRSALLTWKVLFFRDQEITAEQQIEFGRSFGEVTSAHPISPGMADHPEVWERAAADYKPLHMKDTTVPTIQAPRDYAGWHIDITFVANPAMGSILRGVEIPDLRRRYAVVQSGRGIRRPFTKDSRNSLTSFRPSTSRTCTTCPPAEPPSGWEAGSRPSIRWSECIRKRGRSRSS